MDEERRRADASIGYALLRIMLGLNILMHGLVRLPRLGEFAGGLEEMFAKTILPDTLVVPFAYALPIAEAVVGALVLVGLWLRPALVAGALLMGMLIFGTALREAWGTLGSQMVYVLLYVLLIRWAADDIWSIDHWRRRPSS